MDYPFATYCSHCTATVSSTLKLLQFHNSCLLIDAAIIVVSSGVLFSCRNNKCTGLYYLPGSYLLRDGRPLCCVFAVFCGAQKQEHYVVVSCACHCHKLFAVAKHRNRNRRSNRSPMATTHFKYKSQFLLHGFTPSSTLLH